MSFFAQKARGLVPDRACSDNYIKNSWRNLSSKLDGEA